MTTPKELKSAIQLKRRVEYSTMVSKESWSMLGLCLSTLARIQDGSTQPEIRAMAMETIERLNELAFVQECIEADDFGQMASALLETLKRLEANKLAKLDVEVRK